MKRKKPWQASASRRKRNTAIGSSKLRVEYTMHQLKYTMHQLQYTLKWVIILWIVLGKNSIREGCFQRAMKKEHNFRDIYCINKSSPMLSINISCSGFTNVHMIRGLQWSQLLYIASGLSLFSLLEIYEVHCSVNVWIGVLSNPILWSYLLPTRLTRHSY